MAENETEQPKYDYTNKYDSDKYDDNWGYLRSEINKNTLLIALGVIALILVVVLLIKSCSAGKLKGIKVGSVPIIYVGDKEEIQVATVGRGNRSETRFDFLLKNDIIATLEDDMQMGSEVKAVIKGKKPGDTTLTVNAELGNKKFSDTVNIIVCGRLEVENITNNTIALEKGMKKSLKLGLGDNEKCYASLSFDFGADGIVRQVSDDEIEALEEGKTTLTITDGGKGRVTYDVIVTDPNAKVFATDIKVSASSLSVCLGESKDLEATILPENVSDNSVVWSSNKTSVATVSNGRVTGESVGTAQITVMTQDGSDKTATVNVQVAKCGESNSSTNPTSEVKVNSITLSPSSPTVEVGSTTTVSVGITPTDATNQTVTCKSANTKYFTVTSDGKSCILTGVEEGSAKLIVTANDGSNVEKTVTVTINKATSGGSSGSGSSSGSSCVKIKSKSLSISKSSVSDGETFTATATWTPSNAKVTSISWNLQSGLTKVSQFDSDGKSVITVKATNPTSDGTTFTTYIGTVIYGCDSSDSNVIGTKSVTIGAKSSPVTCNITGCSKCDKNDHCEKCTNSNYTPSSNGSSCCKKIDNCDSYSPYNCSCIKCTSAAYYTLSNGKCCQNVTGCTSYSSSCKCVSCDTKYYDYSNGSCIKKKTTTTTTYTGTCSCYTGTYSGTCTKTYGSSGSLTGCLNLCYGSNVCLKQSDNKYYCTGTKTVSGSTNGSCSQLGSGWSGTLSKETKSFNCDTYSNCTSLCTAKGMTLKSGSCTKQ